MAKLKPNGILVRIGRSLEFEIAALNHTEAVFEFMGFTLTGMQVVWYR
jgi:hypothetical protein